MYVFFYFLNILFNLSFSTKRLLLSMLEIPGAIVMVAFSPIRHLDRHSSSICFAFQSLVPYMVRIDRNYYYHADNHVFTGEADLVLPYVIVGDEAFPLCDQMMRPYPGRNLPGKNCTYNNCFTM